MDRRQFLVLLASTTNAIACRALAQTSERPRLVALMIVNAENDEEGPARVSAFRKALGELGWVEDRNVRILVRWRVENQERATAYVKELLQLDPDVIVVNGSPALAALKQATTRVPVVFAVVTDPVGSGYVRSLARPGENITGFSTFAPEIGGKWLELLKEIAPRTTRVAGILDPDFKGFAAIWREARSAAAALGLQVSTIAFRKAADDLESAFGTFAKSAGGGLMVLPTALNNAARERIISLAARHRLPAVYPFQHFAAAGGLLAYGFDPLDLFARSAAYVNRILKGERPGDLPVQAPTKFEMIVNMRTAKALDLKVSPLFLARADRVIE